MRECDRAAGFSSAGQDRTCLDESDQDQQGCCSDVTAHVCVRVCVRGC